MCDENTVQDNARVLGVTRRAFTAGTLAASVAMMLPKVANALSVTEQDVVVSTPDGEADCFFVAPSTGRHPGVLIWPDILGLRPAFRAMGRRLAESGYAVLVVNPYYRTAQAPVVAEGATFQDPVVREKLMGLAQTLSAATNVTDAEAFVTFLDAQASVDTRRKIGTTGYCMGGPMTMRTAAALPDRVGAGASFHGGRLATDGADSPHLLVPQMQAHYLFAIAENDDEREPDAKHVLREAFAAADLPAEIEVYEGALHGWCPPDSPVYHEAQAERAWDRLLNLLATAL